jgi:hypothetical protein
MAAVGDLRRVQWDARAVFLVTDFVPWTLHDALRARRDARELAAEGRPDRSVQYEDYEWTIAVVSDMAEALSHLWRLDMLHLDISTKNITIAPSGDCDSGVTGSKARPHAVLIDFGSAITLTALRSLGDCSGNRPHLAPEVLRAAEEHRRSTSTSSFDASHQPVFELGVLAYEIALGGEHPLPGYPDTVRVWADADMPVLPADQFPPAFSELLVSCVRYAAAERPSLEYVVGRIRQLRAEEGLAPGYRLPPRVPCVRVQSAGFKEAVQRCLAHTPTGTGAGAPAAPSPSTNRMLAGLHTNHHPTAHLPLEPCRRFTAMMSLSCDRVGVGLHHVFPTWAPEGQGAPRL